MPADMAALLQAAIKSLDNLNDQIVQFIYTPSRKSVDRDKRPAERDLTIKDHDTLKSSMSLMRHLLVDAQVKFRKMVEDNKRLASRIDGSIQAANQEVKAIRDELEDTNRRLTQLGVASDNTGGAGDGLREGLPTVEQPQETGTLGLEDQEREELVRLREENVKLNSIIEDLNSELCRLRESKDSNNSSTESVNEGESPEANEQQISAVTSPQVAASPSEHAVQRPPPHSEQFRELQQQVVQAHQELTRAKQALLAMQAARKRLQSEKLDLLSQLRQLYCTLDDKDSEIRDFIRNFEQQMRESKDNIKQLAMEKEESEREKWEILKKAQDASERCVIMKSGLEERDNIISELEARLNEGLDQIRNYENQLKNCSISVDSSDQVTSNSSSRLKSSSVSVDSVLKPSSLDGGHSPSSEDLPPYQEIVVAGDRPLHSNKSLQSNSSQFSLGGPNLSQSLENMAPAAESSRSSEDMTNTNNHHVSVPSEIKTYIDLKTLNKKRRSNSSAFSRLFGKSRSRRSIAVSDPSILEDHVEEMSPRLSMLSEDNYQFKLNALRQAKEMGITKWKAGHVLSWIEIEMNMPMYGRACGENIKSGKVLLGLSDSELDSALGLESPLHRRKLRLAIEELRDPSTIRFPRASQLDHTWIAHRWLSDLGLPQYCPNFEAQLVDGRLLHVLTKKDLERHLGIQRRFHQNSIMHGVELLRRLKFNKEELMQRRGQCETVDCDPLVWTNHRLLQWLQGIDLHEYVKALHESGLHGAVLVLETSFNAEAFASALNIPNTKSYVRRHLASELENLVRPARATLEGTGKRSRSSSSSLNRSFIRSYRGGPTSEDERKGSSKRLSFRGSLGRALGRKSRQDSSNKKEEEPILTDGSAENISTHKRCHSMEIQGTSV